MLLFSKQCAIADAYATACMVVGPEAAKELVERMNLDALLIMAGEEGYDVWISPGFEDEIKMLD